MMVISGEGMLDGLETEIGKFAIKSAEDFEPAKSGARRNNLVSEFGCYIFLIKSERIVSLATLISCSSTASFPDCSRSCTLARRIRSSLNKASNMTLLSYPSSQINSIAVSCSISAQQAKLSCSGLLNLTQQQRSKK